MILEKCRIPVSPYRVSVSSYSGNIVAKSICLNLLSYYVMYSCNPKKKENIILTRSSIPEKKS